MSRLLAHHRILATKTEPHVITLKTKNPPVVGLESAAMAAYVRFSLLKVARTEVRDSRKSNVTVDFDASGEVIGIELVGVMEFPPFRPVRSTDLIVCHTRALTCRPRPVRVAA